ncbi:thermonuclease family protein [Candidatus Parcubacteria bacterium]|nr:thermonuclease family protein [Candidatus Parcubacteria bacterium]
MKLIYKILFGVGIFSLIILLLFTKQDWIDFKAQLARVNVNYNQFVKAEYGKPIRVAKAVDGDTIQLINGEYVRYIGIDTPEEFDPRKPVQCFAKEAADRNRQLVEGKEITFYNDVSVKDKYGRWLGFIYLADGTLVNKELILEGYAFSYEYEPDTSKSLEFNQAEKQAKGQKLGLWSACDVTTLKSGREQTNDL